MLRCWSGLCLQWISSLQPLALTLISQELESSTLPFLQRFRNTLHGAYGIFTSNDSLGASTGCWDNIFAVEETMLGRGFVNQVACEGADRVLRTQSLTRSVEAAGLARCGCRTG